MVQGAKYGTVPSNTVQLAGLGKPLYRLIILIDDTGRHVLW